VRSLNEKLKEEMCNSGLVFVWRKKQACNLTGITKIVKDRFNNTGRQDIAVKMAEKSSLTPHREINFSSDHTQNVVRGKKEVEQRGC
jgi:DNA-binding transcriptional regulator of glucitol operon